MSGTRHVARATGSVHARKASTAVAGTRTEVVVLPRRPDDPVACASSTPPMVGGATGAAPDRYASALPMSASMPIMDSMRARELR